MAAIEKFKKHPETGRVMHLLEIDSLEDWPEEIALKSRHWVLFLACDAREVHEDDLAAFAAKVLEQGMVYLSTWGEDSERVHDVFDEVDAEKNPDSTADDVVLSEWHEDEPLAEALRFAVASASPALAYEDSARATLAVSVGNTDWAEKMRRWLKDPDALDTAAEDEEEEEEAAGDGEAAVAKDKDDEDEDDEEEDEEEAEEEEDEDEDDDEDEASDDD